MAISLAKKDINPRTDEGLQLCRYFSAVAGKAQDCPKDNY